MENPFIHRLLSTCSADSPGFYSGTQAQLPRLIFPGSASALLSFSHTCPPAINKRSLPLCHVLSF